MWLIQARDALGTGLSIRFVGAGVGCSLFGRRYIFRSRTFQDLLRFFSPGRIVTVDRQKNPAVFNASFVPLGFIFRNTHTDQSPCYAPYSFACCFAYCSTYKWKTIYGRELLYSGPLFTYQLSHHC